MPGPDDFDPMQGLDEEDRQYLAGHRDAFARQKAAHDRANASMAADIERRKAAEEHIKATQLANGVAPSTHTPASPVAIPVAIPVVSPSDHLSILIATPDPNAGLPPTTEKFAPDWNVMKEIIAKYDGTWIVTQHEFNSNVPNILGFFGKEGWQKPADSEKHRFEVIVKSGRVFRTDP